MAAKKKQKKSNGGDLGFEATLWQAADKLRNNLDAAEYKHVVLGLIFLKYISDAFEEHRAKLEAGEGEYEGADPEQKDEYMAENVFWVPKEARWPGLQAHAKQPDIGKRIDEAMVAIEKDNPRLKGVLPKDFARPALDKHRLGELIDLIATIDLVASNQPSPQPSPRGRGSEESELPSPPGRNQTTPQHLPSPPGRGAGGEGDVGNKNSQHYHQTTDILGRVYEYFLSQFASAEGKKGGQFYTPRSVVALLVEMLAPEPNSRIYDPCCGSGGMFVQSEKFVEEHGGRIGDIAVYGQESNPTTRRLAAMNLAIRGIEADLGPEHADTFRRDLHPDLKADYVLANPPFNDSDWHRKEDDIRWQYGTPPAGNANYAWVQHFLHHLAPGGTAGFVLANGSMSSNQSGEGEIRKTLLEAGLVDCMVALPGQLFYSTQIPVCLWFISRKKSGKPSPGLRPPSPSGRGSTSSETHPSPHGRGAGGEGAAPHVLFIDARKMGRMLSRVLRELTDEEIRKVADTYHAWRRKFLPSPSGRGAGGEGDPAPYQDIPGFCKSASLEEIASHGWVLTPGRYVGAEALEEDDELFEEKMARLTKELGEQFSESAKLEAAIKTNLEGLGFPI